MNPPPYNRPGQSLPPARQGTQVPPAPLLFPSFSTTTTTVSFVSGDPETSPFAAVVTSTGPMAKTNPFRFSTKWWDDETGLGWWGYRWYSPETGKWLSRDPLAMADNEITLLPDLENPYTFALNDGANNIDYLGLQTLILGPLPQQPVINTPEDEEGVFHIGEQRCKYVEGPCKLGDKKLSNDPKPRTKKEDFYGWYDRGIDGGFRCFLYRKYVVQKKHELCVLLVIPPAPTIVNPDLPEQAKPCCIITTRWEDGYYFQVGEPIIKRIRMVPQKHCLGIPIPGRSSGGGTRG